MAQPGIAEMQQAERQIGNAFFPAFDCAMVLATILGITGAVRIYHNMQAGKHHFDREAANWFYAALFMVLSGVFLRALFGI
ncbi:hypothetical protein GCM10023149_50650 [Mucilaginibacter gynuensis]|uniref:DUF4134 domain-containing protein n=2 Tax=Mucilaginibacter gynuensis TaxID=1302236 RepID=A0ABP8HIU1_9SPHI